MGALKNKIPITHWTMWVGSVAIAGIPGLAGFFSKDEILWQAYSSPQGSMMLYAVGLATAAMTAFYMWRLMNMTFYGKSRVAPEVAATFDQETVMLEKGDLVLAFSDGVTEAMNENSEEFGDDSLVSLMRNRHGQDPRRILEELVREVKKFTGDALQSDDVTMMVVRFDG